MGKILACDFGLKRTGLAITDELQMIASPLETVSTSDIWEYLDKLLSRDKIDIIVVGDPRNLDGRTTDATDGAMAFFNKLKKRYPLVQVEQMNEMFTSKMASRALVAGGMKKSKRREKGSLDKVSAALILQDYLAYR